MIQDSFVVAWYSMNIIWENPKKNLEQIESYLTSLTKSTDILVLPEMCTTGFSMNASALAETMNGPSVLRLKALSEKFNCALVGSLIIQKENAYYNRLFFIQPNGNIAYYDKKHLFTFAGEDKVYSNGKKKLIVDYKGWKIACFVCYDLRFPVWIRNSHPFYDLSIFVANWPESRVFAWNQLLVARSIENLTYTIGVNRIGEDGKGLKYQESSSVYGPDGKKLVSDGESTCVLKKSDLERFRNQFRFLDDADQFEL